jgi:hypothetical protein
MRSFPCGVTDGSRELNNFYKKKKREKEKKKEKESPWPTQPTVGY